MQTTKKELHHRLAVQPLPVSCMHSKCCFRHQTYRYCCTQPHSVSSATLCSSVMQKKGLLIYFREFTALTATVSNPVLPRLGLVPLLRAVELKHWPISKLLHPISKLLNYRMMTGIICKSLTKCMYAFVNWWSVWFTDARLYLWNTRKAYSAVIVQSHQFVSVSSSSTSLWRKFTLSLQIKKLHSQTSWLYR